MWQTRHLTIANQHVHQFAPTLVLNHKTSVVLQGQILLLTMRFRTFVEQPVALYCDHLVDLI
jgi:hypothetical protein